MKELAQMILVLSVIAMIGSSACNNQHQVQSLYAKLCIRCTFQSSVDSTGTLTVVMKCDSTARSGNTGKPYNIKWAVPAYMLHEHRNRKQEP